MSMEEKRSGAMRIFEALSGVDVKLLENCEMAVSDEGKLSRKKLIFKWRTMHTVAAAVCVVAVGVALWSRQPDFLLKSAVTEDCAMESEMLVQEAAAVADGNGCNVAEDAGGGGDFAYTAGTDNDNMGGNATCADEIGKLDDAKGAVGTKEENLTDSGMNTKYKDVGNSTMESGSTQDSYQSQMMQDSEKESTEDFVGNKEIAQIENQLEASPLDTREDITEDAAREVAILGGYIPTGIPEGYTFSSGKASVNRVTGAYETITLFWVKGMDDIMISISKASAGNIHMTDIAEEAAYNVHLYQIPYAESVPEKYWTEFQEPIFAVEELTVKVVEARMKSVADLGDTDTPRGSFAVFYDEGVLVRFSGRGTAEEIWRLFESIEPE